MAKPRIIIADVDINYIIPLQLKFAEDYFERVDLEIISDRNYFVEFFSTPQRADILIISESLYDSSIQRHDISHIFRMTEQYEENQTAELNVNHLFKYTSIKEIFNDIVGKSSDVLRLRTAEKKDTQIVLVYSACGGVGKTTVATGIASSLTKNYKRILYINASHLQTFQHLLENPTPIANEAYARLVAPTETVYGDIKHTLRKELFTYLPPFKASLMSLSLQFSIYQRIIISAQKSGDYDYIIVDADVCFDDNKASLLNIADKVIIVTKQTFSSVFATNHLVSNINGINPEKYYFICNDFSKDEDNALISPNISLKFSVSEYIDHFRHYEQMSHDDFSKEGSIQRAAFLIM